MAVEQTLATLSNQLVYSAMLVYTGAMAAYAVDLSGRGARVAVAARQLVGPDGAPVAHGSADASVGGSSPAPFGGSSDTPLGGSSDTPGPILAPEPGPVPDRTAGRTPDDARGPGADPGRRTKIGGIAVALTWLAFALHLGGVVARGASVHRAPWGNMYEFSVSGAVVVTGVFLAVLLRRDVRYLGTFVVSPVLLTLGLAVSVLYTRAAPLVPALQSFWLVIHVSVAFIASALFTLGFSSTLLQLVQERREAARAFGRTPSGGRFMDQLPGAVELERSSYRLHAIAFPLWTFTVMAGAIWAEHAWGRYWNWDPKEVWSFVIWVVYAAYLHARATRGWDRRRAAYLALAGYGCILFNFLVVNIFFVGLHSYAK